MNKYTLSLFTCLSLGALSACTIGDFYGPSATPRGYAHTHREYKTVIPDRPYFIGDEYSDEEVIQSEELWTMGINELLNELELNSFMNGLSVSLQPVSPTNSFDVRMDYYLRKALKDRGYLIVTDTISSVPVLNATARLPGYETGLQSKGRVKDDLDNMREHFDVMEDPKNNGQPYVFMGIEVYDMSAPKEEQLLLKVETLQTVLDKDMHEIRGALIDAPLVYGVPPKSNINP